jgi:8-oxo-dGTP diphosphatase
MVSLYVIALLCAGDTIVLLRRHNTGFGDGLYSLPGGKVEEGETVKQAIKREIYEEVGLDLPQADFNLVHTFHRKGTENEMIVLCFKADITTMPAPTNKEPEKHDDMRFFNLNQLPENMIPAHKQALEYIKKGTAYSEHGWSK